jgi:hypothetical protein
MTDVRVIVVHAIKLPHFGNAGDESAWMNTSYIRNKHYDDVNISTAVKERLF